MGLLLLLVAAIAVCWLRASRQPVLIYQDNADNQRLLAKLPLLRKTFRPTPWAFNAHLQLLLLTLKNAIEPELTYDEVQQLRMADGGTTALCWLGLDLPPETPTLLVLHTIGGTAQSMRTIMRDLQRRTGWRLVLCLRRGHGDLPLTAARFNTMGDTADLREQLDCIRQRLPASALYAIGISAGSGLLVRYLGEQGADTPVRAGMAYCPGYDISVAFSRAKPFYSRLMAKEMARDFILARAEQLQEAPAFAACAAADDLHEFQRQLYGIAGYPDRLSYLAASNPVAVMDNISVPLLVLNAEDDPVCVIDNVREHESRIAVLPQAILAVTRRGSHCAYFAGWRADCWAHRLAAAYFAAVHDGTSRAG